MRYMTGPIVLGVPCKDDSVGKWNLTKGDFTNEDNIVFRESSESIYGDYGIETFKMIPYHGDELYHVATHTRYYLDALAERKFDELDGVFAEAINSGNCRNEIFKMVYRFLRDKPFFKEVHRFLHNEFGNAWVSFYMQQADTDAKIKRGAERYAEHISSGKSPNIKSNSGNL